jgi:hypothetical protein
MVENPSEPHLAGLRELYVTLDRMTEYTEGMDARQVREMRGVTRDAIDIVEAALDEERQVEIDEEADQLVEAMIKAVGEEA